MLPESSQPRLDFSQRSMDETMSFGKSLQFISYPFIMSHILPTMIYTKRHNKIHRKAAKDAKKKLKSSLKIPLKRGFPMLEHWEELEPESCRNKLA